MTLLNGTVLWYRPAADQGVVRSDEGRQYFFSQAAALEPSAGLRVTFSLSPDAPPKALGLALLGGGRTIASTPAPPSSPAKRSTATRSSAPKKSATAKVAAPLPRPKAGAAKAPGTPVFHPMWGPGHVTGSTAHFVSVDFLSGGRRNVPDAELQDVSGHRGTPAPEKKSRKTTFNDRPAKTAGRSHVRRERTSDEEAPAAKEDGGWGTWDNADEE